MIKKILKGWEYMKYCCNEHVELALDEAVDEFETAPQLMKLEAVDKSGFVCGYCGQPAVYIVANE
jgi:CxxH/CxxC protein (TIGR04129 family)